MLAADRRRKDPREVPRPGAPTEPQIGLTGDTDNGFVARGLSGFLAHAQMTGAVRFNG